MPLLETQTGARLAYLDRGAGPAVLLLHGWSFSSAVFDDLAEALAPRHRVVAPDLRGHGASEPGARFDLAALAGDAVALVDHLALPRVALVGWSLGAQVALAALPLLGPRVSALALVSATPRFTAGEGWPHGLPAQAVEVLAHRVRRDPARALARFCEGLFAEGELDAEGRTRAADLRARVPLPSPAAAQDGLAVLAGADLRGALRAVTAPTLLIHGEEDPICLPGAARAAAEAIPGARLALLPGAGHLPLLSRPEAVRALLLPFLAAHP